MTALALLITDAGRAAIVNAQNTGTAPIVLSQVALGSGTYDPAAAPGAARTALSAEFKRLSTFGAEVVAPDTLHVTITDTSADTYNLGEIGLYTNTGVLFAVYSQATPILEKGAQQLVLLSADILLTSVQPGSVTIGDTDFMLPPATTERQGIVEIATNAEALAGTDTVRAVTPAGLAAALANKANSTGSYSGLNVGWAQYATQLRPPAGDGVMWPNDAFGGSGDTASIVLANGGGEAQRMRFSLSNDPDDYFEFVAASVDGLKVNGHTVLNAANWGNYAPSKTGAGASGTWGINISGNADTVDGWHRDDLRSWSNLIGKPAGADIDFHWSGQAGQPTWLWGQNEAGAAYVWNPANFSVNYANSAGNADSVDGWHRDDLRSWGNLTGKPDGADIQFSWYDPGGQPTYVWGSNTSGQAYVYNPAGFSVAYATNAGSASSAGNADMVDGYHASQLWRNDAAGGFFSENGYQRLPSGLIIQWGVATAAEGAGALVTFPTAFPSACRNVVATYAQGADKISLGTHSLSSTSFRLNGWSYSCYWIAIGH